MVKRIIWPFHLGDFQRDTKHLNVTEKGAYFLLLADYWSRGSLPDDERDIQRIAEIHDNRTWARIKPRLQAFFYDGWKHKRIEMDLKAAAEMAAKAQKAARFRWHVSGAQTTRAEKPNRNNKNAMQAHSGEQCFPSSFNKEAKPSLLDASASAGSLATAPLKGALRSPASQLNKFQKAWMDALERQEPQVYAEAIGYLLADKETRDRITSAEIRERGSGVMAAAIAWHRWKKQQA
jgi:uncharacterized protein YdaU (DUF1376 family)